MNGEFNELAYNNTGTSFSLSTNNIETSDELNVGPIYRQGVDTKYAQRKRVSKTVLVVGISLALTASIVSTGSILSNVFVVNPPTVANTNYVITENGFEYAFTISNSSNYKSYYYLKLDNQKVLEEDCTTEGEYSGIYADITNGQTLEFVVEFTNSFDYIKSISYYQVVVERN